MRKGLEKVCKLEVPPEEGQSAWESPGDQHEGVDFWAPWTESLKERKMRQPKRSSPKEVCLQHDLGPNLLPLHWIERALRSFIASLVISKIPGPGIVWRWNFTAPPFFASSQSFQVLESITSRPESQQHDSVLPRRNREEWVVAIDKSNYELSRYPAWHCCTQLLVSTSVNLQKSYFETVVVPLYRWRQ